MSAWIIAPPEMLSAYSLVNSPDLGSGAYDPAIATGAHLRLFAGGGKSFPLSPFAVFRTKSSVSTLDLIAPSGTSDWSSEHVTFQNGPVEFSPLLAPSEAQCLVAIDFDDSEGRLDRVTLLDHRGRVMKIRDHAPWSFSAPRLHRFRLEGDGRIRFSIRVINLDILTGSCELSAVLGLPIAPDVATQRVGHWYVGHHTDGDGMERVRRGAAQSLNRMDLAFGDLGSGSLSPERDVERAQWLLANGAAGGNAGEADLRRLLGRLIDDRTPPWDLAIELGHNGKDGKKRQSIAARPIDMIQMGAMDPALGHYFGFGAVSREDLDLWDNGQSWDTYAIVGLLAYDPAHYEAIGVNLNPMPDASDWTGVFKRMLVDALETSNFPYKDQIEERIAAVEAVKTSSGRFLAAQPFLTFVSPFPGWRPPDPPLPRIFDRHWHSATSNVPSSQFRASFAFDAPPMASLVAMSQAAIGFDAVTRHTTDRVEELTRAVPMILGSTFVLPDPRTQSFLFEPAGIVTDREIEGEVGTLVQSFRFSDMFGRFGEATSLEFEAPPRPKPPQPIIRYWLDPAAPAAPRVLCVKALLPEPGDDPFLVVPERETGALIIVPRVEDMESGSRAIKALILRFEGEQKILPLANPGTAEARFTLPEPPVNGTIAPVLTAIYVADDEWETESEPAHTAVALSSHVKPKPFPTGVGLFWTSRPGPAEHVTFKLGWKGESRGRYRVYLADESAFGVWDNSRTRPQIATEVCKLVRDPNPPRNRDRYQLLTEHPIEADQSGYREYVGKLPRSLSKVQFIRVVPVDNNGNEAPFENCGIVPIAVPDDRRPPAPSQQLVEFDEETGVGGIEVVTDALNGRQLLREEPELDDGGGRPPLARLLISAGPVDDPVYARPSDEHDAKLIVRDQDRYVFAAKVPFGPLEPFVPYTCWAQIRLPDESRTPPGVKEINVGGGVEPVEPSARKNAPRPFSTPSVPRMVMRTPRPTLQMLDGASARLTNAGLGELEVSVPAAPVGHPLMSGPYRLALWALWPDTSEAIVASDGQWHPIVDAEASFRLPIVLTPGHTMLTGRLRLAIVDPLGRIGPMRDLAFT